MMHFNWAKDLSYSFKMPLGWIIQSKIDVYFLTDLKFYWNNEKCKELVNSKIKQLPLFSFLCATSEYVTHNVLKDPPFM